MPGPGRPAKGRPPKAAKAKSEPRPPRAGDEARKIGAGAVSHFVFCILGEDERRTRCYSVGNSDKRPGFFVHVTEVRVVFFSSVVFQTVLIE